MSAIDPPPVSPADFGRKADTAATSDTGSFTFIALFKRLLGYCSSGLSVFFAGVTHTDRSGTITAGGTAQTLMAANSARKGYWIQNQSSSDLWLSSVGTAAASQPSMKITAGSLYESPIGGCAISAISIYGATTSQAFSAREW